MGETRTAAEVAGLRAEAEAAHGQSPYRTSVSEAVTATLDWLGGTTLRTPITGDEATPDGPRVGLERVRAEDTEQRARRAHADGTRPGVVAQTIAWWRREQYAESPL